MSDYRHTLACVRMVVTTAGVLYAASHDLPWWVYVMLFFLWLFEPHMKVGKDEPAE
jgi:hypothetical protein